ncbi:MAG: stage III sporulation AC/AD family protein, partial [Oscillospiraceae bacterium]|nr:stage III sporulation AC/AD family protein [Oscillospiraceae bacterium]
YLEMLWKSIGICYLTGIAADLCRDSGESAMASVAELWGRITLLVLMLPMAKSLLELMIGVLQ